MAHINKKDCIDSSSYHQKAALSTSLPHNLSQTSKQDEMKYFTKGENVCSLKQHSSELAKRAGWKHPPLQRSYCKKCRCLNKLKKNWQEQLRCKFWNLDNFHSRKRWLLNHFVGWKTNHWLPEAKVRNWFVPDSAGSLTKVCRVFFLNTFNYKWSSILHFLLKHSPRLTRTFNSKCSHLKGLCSTSDRNIKLLILMHIKSFLKKYHSPMKKLERVYDFSLVKRSFHSFIATRPSFTVSYLLFRKIFHIIFAIFILDPAYVSIMPPTTYLRQAYQKCDLLDNMSLHAGKTSPETVVESSQSSEQIRNYPQITKFSTKDKRQDENEKVILHLDIGHDDVVITRNISDSDSDNEEREIVSQTAKSSIVKPELCKISQVHDCSKKTQLQIRLIKEEYPLLTPCHCTRRCFNKISETRRKEIYSSFWDLKDHAKQKQWVEAHTQESHRKQFRGRKHVRKDYFLTNDTNKSVVVCAVYFHRTLGFTSANWLNVNSFEGEQSFFLNQINQKKNVDGTDVHVQRCVENYVRGQIPLAHLRTQNSVSSQSRARSAGWSVKTFHKKYLTTHPDCPVSFESFQDIYDQLSQSSMQHTNHEDKKYDSSVAIRQSSRERIIRKCNESLFLNSGGNNSKMPKRQRSVRATKMQGNLVEGSTVKLDVASEAVSRIVCTQKHHHRKEKTGQQYLEVQLKLCQNSSRNHPTRRSQTLEGSFINVINMDMNHNMQSECPSTVQQMNIKLYPSKRAASDIQQKKCSQKSMSDICKYRRRKKNRKGENMKKESQDTMLSSIKDQSKSEHYSKKQYQLNSLKRKHKHPLLPPCNCRRRRCINKIPEERRKEIHEHFWNLGCSGDRKRWLMKFVEKRERKMKVLSLFPQRKNESKKYFLPYIKEQRIEVCRLFFIHTLGFRWDSGVDALVKTKSSSHSSGQNHQWKKPTNHLPEYITDSVKQYLMSIRDSQNIRKEPETVSEVQNVVLNECKNENLTGLKVKDLFQGWKVKFKCLKFNLGYHSFRRIFQSVVDPREEVAMDSNNSAATDDVDIISDNYADENLAQVTLPQAETLCSRNGFENDQSVNSVDNLDQIVTNVNDKTEKNATSSSNELSMSYCIENELENRPMQQDDNSSVLKNDKSDYHEKSTDDTSECVLDVRSGYLKQAGNNDKHYPYKYDYQYKKRKSLSTRNDRSNYPVLPPCKCRKRKCSDKFTEACRQHINDIFWNLRSYNERKQWILEHIRRADIKRRVVFTEGTPRKLESRWYYLPDEDGNKIDVCKAFFLRTLGYRWDSVIDTIGKTTPKGEKWVIPDKRGRKPPPHKISEEAVSSMTLYIENVCQTYQPLCENKSKDSLKESKANMTSLIPFGLTMKQLFEDYKSKHESHKFGYESFRKVFRRVHGAFLASLPSQPESNKEPEKIFPEMTALIDNGYAEPARMECSDSFQTENSQFMSTTESYTDLGPYTTPSQPPPPSVLLPPSSLHLQGAHQQLVGNNASERRSCLYQYNNHQSCQPELLQPPTAMQVPDTGQSLQLDCYNMLDHDPFLKYNHNLYCQSSGMHGHISQMGDHMSYNCSINSCTADTINPSTCGGHTQFPPYFMPHPEPLRRQVYHISQYQSILHQIAESGRLFNYGSFPQSETMYQGSHDKHTKQQDLARDNVTSYNIPKTSHISMSSNIPAQYRQTQHLPHNIQQENTPVLLSPFSDDNYDHDNTLATTKEQNVINNFGNEFVMETSNKKPALKGKTSSTKAKVKKETKLKSKSVRNYGDHYPMLSPCNCKKKKCTEIFSESARKKIHDMFWDLKNYNERKLWMLHHIKREDCKRRRIDQFESFRKQESRWYFFPDENGNKHDVCKDFFLRTLGYKWDSVIDTIKRTTPKGETSTRPDQRGRKAPAHKLSSVILRSVVQYIKSMRQVSQPQNVNCNVDNERVDNPSINPSSIDPSSNNKTTDTGQISIPYGLTMKDLFDDYKAKHMGHKIGYESFRRIFRTHSKSEKIAFDDRMTDDDMFNPDNLVDLY